MTRLFLIRHGEPEAAWGGADEDPGLSPRGREQAHAAAQVLAGLGALNVVSSPMRRCRETAAPFASLARRTPHIEPRVSEIATPAGVADRRAWLEQNFAWRVGAGQRRWDALDAGLRAWRDEVIRGVRDINGDAAVFTHFIAINAIVGAALGREETIVCRPPYGAIAELELRNGVLRVVKLGAEADPGEVR
jgi:broad specificity phosphatase PhoE